MQITLPFPPSVNGLYSTNFKTRMRFKSEAYALWIGKAAYALPPSIVKFTEPVKISYVFGRPDKRTRDLANYLKAVDDFLVSYHILADDSLIHEIHAKWGIAEGVQITIEKLD